MTLLCWTQRPFLGTFVWSDFHRPTHGHRWHQPAPAVLAQTFWAFCQRPFVIDLGKTNKASLPFNPRKNVEGDRGHISSLWFQLPMSPLAPFSPGRTKWQNRMPCSIGLHWVSQDRAGFYFKKASLCLSADWGHFLPFSILPNIPDLYVLQRLPALTWRKKFSSEKLKEIFVLSAQTRKE